MSRMLFVSPPDGRLGFGLAGMPHRVADEQDAEQVMVEIVEQGEGSLVIVDERLVHALDEERFLALEKQYNGVFIVLPAPERQGVPEGDYARQLISRAVGYHVRIEPEE